MSKQGGSLSSAIGILPIVAILYSVAFEYSFSIYSGFNHIRYFQIQDFLDRSVSHLPWLAICVIYCAFVGVAMNRRFLKTIGIRSSLSAELGLFIAIFILFAWANWHETNSGKVLIYWSLYLSLFSIKATELSLLKFPQENLAYVIIYYIPVLLIISAMAGALASEYFFSFTNLKTVEFEQEGEIKRAQLLENLASGVVAQREDKVLFIPREKILLIYGNIRQ